MAKDQQMPGYVKIFLLIAALFMPVFLILPFFFWGGEDGSISLGEQNLQEGRLKPVGTLVVQDENADAQTDSEAGNQAGNEEVAAAAFDPASTYKNVCAACHATEALGAPVFGNHDDWQARLEANGGLEGLYESGLTGVPGTSMMAKGGSDMSDEQFHDMVVYMLDNAEVEY